MYNRKFKVYTLWELAIPIKNIKSTSIGESNIFVYWDGTIKPIRRDLKMADSLNEADRQRRELIPTKELIHNFSQIIQCINKEDSDNDYDSSVMLSLNLLMEILLNEETLIIRTRQHPSIHKVEINRFCKRLCSVTTPNTIVKWDYESQLIRKSSSSYQVFCPLCNKWFVGSLYLSTVFIDERNLWLANMVTHYRHTHIKSWDKMWGRYGGYYQQAAHYYDEDYEDRKSEINERAKRQIARRAVEFLRENNVDTEVFRSLLGTCEKTIKVVDGIFTNKR